VPDFAKRVTLDFDGTEYELVVSQDDNERKVALTEDGTTRYERISHTVRPIMDYDEARHDAGLL